MRTFVLYSIAHVLVVAAAALVPEDALLLIAGLPGHPLLVHSPAVLLPLGAIALVLLVALPKVRSSWHWLVLGMLAIGAASAILAKKSGEAFLELQSVSEQHEEWGELLANVSVAQLVVAIGFVATTLFWRQRAGAIITGAIAVVLAITSIGLTIAVGHSGAESVWSASVPANEEDDAELAPEPVAPSASPSERAADSSGAEESVTTGYTLAEVAEHASPNDCWTVVNGNVYDLTGFASSHEGGAANIHRLCGIDGTAAFTGQHGGESRPESQLSQFLLGPLVG